MRQAVTLAVSFCLLCSLAVAGCGGAGSGSSGGGGPDPVQALPASSMLALEADVRPEGDQRDALEALLGRVLRTDDAAKKLEQLFDDNAGKEFGGTYAKDVAPWLGRRAAMTVTDLAGNEPGFLGAVATTDSGKAADFVARTAKADHERKASIAGHVAWVDSDGTVVGVVDDFVLVASTQAQFKRGADTLGGDSLADAKRYTDAIDQLPDERLGSVWIDPQGFADLASAKAADPSARGIIDQAFKGIKPVTAALIAADDAASIEARVSVTGEAAKRLGAADASAADLVRSLPADAWAALGSPDVGKSISQSINGVAGGIGSAVLGGQLRQATGLDLQSDLLSWVGDVGLFVRGESLSTLGGALVIEATNPAKAAAALPRLVGAARQQLGAPFQPVSLAGAEQAFSAPLPGAPGPLVVARGKDRVVVALGEAAAKAGLSPASTLGDSGRYDAAKSANDGLDPTLLVDAPPVVRLLGESAGSDPDFAKAKPYLDMLDLLTVGVERDGNTARSRMTVKVR